MRYLFIPSCDVKPIDELSGTFTELRLRKGLELWRTGNYDCILVSGGVFYPQDVQNKAAGWLMWFWLIGNVVASKAILIENKSVDTYENIRFGLQLIPDIHLADITIVTHWQHALRMKITFWRAYGLKVKVIPLWYWIGCLGFIKELGGLFVHLFDKEGVSPLSKRIRQRRTQSR